MDRQRGSNPILNNSMGVQWISYRRKSELQAILKEFGQDIEGTMEELRARLSQFANQPGLPTAPGDDHGPSGSGLADQTNVTPGPPGLSVSIFKV